MQNTEKKETKKGFQGRPFYLSWDPFPFFCSRLLTPFLSFCPGSALHKGRLGCPADREKILYWIAISSTVSGSAIGKK